MTAVRTSSVAGWADAGLTVAGTPVTSTTPSARALASAASLTDWPSDASIFVGSIQEPELPRYQPSEPEFMTTSMSTCCSTTVSLTVWGNCRSTSTEATHGSRLSWSLIWSLSMLSRVVPSSSVSRLWTSDSLTCVVPSTTTLSTEKIAESLRTKKAMSTARPMAHTATTAPPMSFTRSAC